CMNRGSGKNIDWFWKKWFFENGEPDLAISNVVPSGSRPSVTITLKGSKPVPIDLTVNYDNGQVQTLHRSVAVWENGNTSYVFNFPSGKKISKLSLGS